MALCCAAFVVIRLAMERGGSRYDGSPRSEGPAGDSLASLIVDLRKEHNLVGIGAMVTVDDQVEAAAVQGERKAGSGVPLELGDRWHLGGISKSVTATMIARLIEAGQMQWTETIGESFPDAPMHPDWKPVTLLQLLTDTAGARKPSSGVFGASGRRSCRATPSASRGSAESARRKTGQPAGHEVRLPERRLHDRRRDGRAEDRRRLGRSRETRSLRAIASHRRRLWSARQ